MKKRDQARFIGALLKQIMATSNEINIIKLLSTIITLISANVVHASGMQLQTAAVSPPHPGRASPFLSQASHNEDMSLQSHPLCLEPLASRPWSIVELYPWY